MGRAKMKIHDHKRMLILAMMQAITHFFFICSCSCSSIIGISSISPNKNSYAAACWVAPPRSVYNVPSYNGATQNAEPCAPSLNLAVQEKILEGLRMAWGSNLGNTRVNSSVSQSPPPSNSEQPVPFIIQKIGRGKKSEIEEISRMCIDVFFNEQKDVSGSGGGKKQTPPWKAVQLAYLRNFQEGDILARNAFNKDQLVDLIVARRIYPISAAADVNENLLYDESQIYNLENNWSGGRGYAIGEIIGYSEVSEKNFGLGGNFDSDQRRDNNRSERPRPYISNLSVIEYARRSGVGSRLLDACEECVRDWNVPDHTEIVLQVEEDNPTAIQFYKRRGWEFVFADPTCRKYDTSGFFLKESRVTKYAMIKRLSVTNGSSDGDGPSDNDSGSFMQKLRNSFFVQQ